MGVLADARVIDQVLICIESVSNPLPPDHLRYASMGGFSMPLGPGYGEMEKYWIRTYGLYFRALANGKVTALEPGQEHFVRAARGEVGREGQHESAWLKFKADYPTLAEPDTH